MTADGTEWWWVQPVAHTVLWIPGGTAIDGKANIIASWLWDPSRQGAGKPPEAPIELRMNKYLTFKFVNRQTITVAFRCDAVVRVTRSAGRPFWEGLRVTLREY